VNEENNSKIRMRRGNLGFPAKGMARQCPSLDSRGDRPIDGKRGPHTVLLIRVAPQKCPFSFDPQGTTKKKHDYAAFYRPKYRTRSGETSVLGGKREGGGGKEKRSAEARGRQRGTHPGTQGRP
jgi:hypothetical protein